MIRRKLYYWLGPKGRRLARRLLYLPGDLAGVFSPQDLVPPKGLNFTGAGDFIAIGNKFINLAKRQAHLTTSARVLDIGSGLGRMARPLAGYLDNSGYYCGFDVVPDGVDWCKRHYKEMKNFHFQFIPLKNDLYNSEIALEPEEFAFPYQSANFDLVLSISVFTHMQLPGVTRYLYEASRVLKAGGYMIATFFIVDDTWNQDQQSSFRKMFPFERGGVYLHHLKVKDANVAFAKKEILSLVEHAGFRITANFPGWWNDERNKDNRFDYQDVLILKKLDEAENK